MEVHHHAHTPRKKWTHYFWEFLMLFLAVTLGFFVENQREHYVEHLREKQYAQSLYDDLKIDTQTIQRTIAEKKWAVKKMDSLETILASGKIEENNELIYYFERFLTRKDIFTSQDVTYRQLLSSGNFRYFRNLKLYKDISNYYNLYERYHTLPEATTATVTDLTQLEIELFDPTDLSSLYNREVTSFYTIFNRPARPFKPVKASKAHLDLLQLKAADSRNTNEVSATFLSWLQTEAIKILLALKQEYHLK